MIGFLVGTACLVGLVRVIRGGRACGGHGYGPGCGGFGHRDPGEDPGFRRWGRAERGWGGSPFARGGEGRGAGLGRRFFLRTLFHRLDTTPGQEKVIKAAMDDLQAKARAAKDEALGARAEIAKAMRSDSFDEVMIGGATAQLDGSVDTMRKAGIDAFAKVHEALDEKQRALLADLIESGPRGFFGGYHPYRGEAV